MPSLVHRVILRNYKSCAACDVTLGALAVLVGPNGSGKSNFIDALHFVKDALSHTVEFALQERGGIDNVRRRSGGRPNDPGIHLELDLPNGIRASYAFELGAKADGGFVVKRERCRIDRGELVHGGGPVEFDIRAGKVESSTLPIDNALAPDRLALVSVSGRAEFRPLFDALCGMAFYALSADRMRALQRTDPGLALGPDGGNVAAVLREMRRLGKREPLSSIREYLAIISPGIIDIASEKLGSMETLRFQQRVGDLQQSFEATSMSDGTVRALGVLVALHQDMLNGHGKGVRLVAIEEPEVAVHPAVVRVLGEACIVASRRVQVVLTTHSPDLLDHESFGDDVIRAVRMENGRTQIGLVDEASRSAIRDRLFTPGELLRQNQLEPAAKPLLEPEQLNLFVDPPNA
jgi:predicted ATPase